MRSGAAKGRHVVRPKAVGHFVGNRCRTVQWRMRKNYMRVIVWVEECWVLDSPFGRAGTLLLEIEEAVVGILNVQCPRDVLRTKPE
jgi:hypothetical protein